MCLRRPPDAVQALLRTVSVLTKTISVTDRDNPYAMAQARGRVTARLDGSEAWAIIDRLSVKYTGQPYPLRTGRVVYLVEPEHARASSYG